MNVRAALTPGTISPWRPVPASIPRPEYVGKKQPKPYRGSHVQRPETIEKMRVASRLAAQATALAGEHCKPGVTTDEIDRVVHEFLCDHGAYPSTLGYKGFPKSCCTSLNEVICHGIPDSTVIEDGDIINVDVTAFIGGVHGDTDATFCVGEVSEEARLLVERTREAMMRGVKAVAPGIAETFHSGLYVPHYDNPALATVMEVGMTFTIEPMITLGTHDYEMWDDGWTVVTRDRRWTAQFEHTLVVTEDGAEILTLP
jgi:methionyl aminopeptidase